MTFMVLIVYLIIYCIWGSIWGWAVNKVIENKGYRENWFWWGFFFGMIALLVALTKPDRPRTADESSNYFEDSSSIVGKNYVFRGFGSEPERKADYAKGEWRCVHCGTVNAGYVGTCGCGCDKSGQMPVRQSEQAQEMNENAQEQGQQIFFCISCGKQMEVNAKFCRYCGAKAGLD